MFRVEDCDYDDLQSILAKENLDLSGWKLIKKEYIDGTKLIYNQKEEQIALINFYFLDNEKCKMFIPLFEVFPKHRGKGLGKEIIEQFLENYEGEVRLEPIDDESEMFWKKCGFQNGSYLDRRRK